MSVVNSHRWNVSSSFLHLTLVMGDPNHVAISQDVILCEREHIYIFFGEQKGAGTLNSVN